MSTITTICSYFRFSIFKEVMTSSVCTEYCPISSAEVMSRYVRVDISKALLGKLN